MTNREKLQENYEDALFALLMDDFAQQEGERLIQENEALKDDPAAAVPEDVSRRCLQTIRWALFRHKHKASVKGVGRVFGRLAIAVVLVVALFTTAFAASPEFRAGTLNMLLSFNEKATTWQFPISGSDSIDTDLNVSLGQIPEGYSISNTEQNRFMVEKTYSNPSGAEIKLRVFLAESASFNFDTENSDYYEETTVQRYPAVITDKHGVTSIAWADEARQIMISIDATDLSIEDMKTLAAGVIIT